jgi:replicative DNA helicase
MASLSVISNPSTLADTTDPETEYLSAALHAGVWSPKNHGLSVKDFPLQSRVFSFLTDYFDASGCLPIPQVVAHRFPSFTFTEGLHLGYTARQLSEETYFREVAHNIRTIAQAISDRDATKTHQTLQSTLQMSPTAARKGTSLTDPSLFINDGPQSTFPTYSKQLNAILSGGIACSSFTVVAARLAVGKSFWLMNAALAAVAAGKSVCYLSLEMDTRACAHRMHNMIAKQDINEMEQSRVTAVIGEWMEKTTGTLVIRDPSSGRVTPGVVSAEAEHHDVVIVDYAGLMSTDTGERSIESWQNAGSISNSLMEAAKSSGCSVIAATQLNRNALSHSQGSRWQHTPQAGNIAQSDAYAQDADVIITLQREAPTITRNIMTKNRFGADGHQWFTKFEPEKGVFTDVDNDTARAIIDAAIDMYH